MARLALTPQTKVSLRGYPALPLAADAADVAFTAAGASFADGAGFTITGRELLLVRNPTAGALTVTITSVADRRTKRTGHITAYSVGAGELAVFWLPTRGWRQTDGQLYIAGSAAGIEFAVLRLPVVR